MTKLHARVGCCPAAVAEYQTAYDHGCPATVAGYQKLHVCACCCPAASAVSQTAYKRSAVTCSGRIPNCMHASAVALLQWQNAKLHMLMAALLQWQDTKNYMYAHDADLLQRQFLKQHTSALQSLAVVGYFLIHEH
jgi:hypothetical protein